MASSLKCPSPSCPFLFDPTQVPAGAVLTCPRCAMRFTLGPTAGYVPPADAVVPVREEVRRKETHSRRSSLFATVGIVGFLVILVGGIVGYIFITAGQRPAKANDEKSYRDINMAVLVPEGWEADPDAQKLAKANVVALKRTDGSARLALAAADFKTRPPQPGELREGILVDRLESLFADDEATPVEGATWAGQPALKWTFRGRGRSASGTFLGEAYAMQYKGIAYWLIAWAPEGDYAAAAESVEQFRAGCRLLDLRDDWTATTAGVLTFTGVAADYKLSDGDRWFVQSGEPKNEDVRADLLLAGTFKARKRVDDPPKAWVVGYVLDAKGDDAPGTFRGYVKDRYAKTFNIKKWSELTGPVEGDPPASGEKAGLEVARYFAESSEDARTSKWVGLAVMPGMDGKAIGVEAYCAWQHRTLWEKRLVQIAGSLQTGR